MTLGMRVFGAPTEPTSAIERALAAGLAADRLGYAFAGAYHAAIAKLLGDDTKKRCIAATEKGGGHPKAIETRLEASTLNGEKTFATLATESEEMLVVASRGVVDGKNRLCLVKVSPTAAGVTITPRAPTPFAPEIPHAIVKLANVAVADDDVLSGDGYERYLKPFRTIEDTHVLAATMGYVLGAAKRFDMNRELTESLVALLPGVELVAESPPLDPQTHLTLAGLFTLARRVLAEHDAEWEKAGEEGTRWRRDLAILMVAEQARTARTAAAWAALGGEKRG